MIGGILRTLIIAAALSSASCGYTLAGHGSFLPDTVKTIGIPDFVNHTPYYDVGQTLSQRVRTEFIGRGKYKVLPQATGVDAVLKAQINSITLAPTAFNSSQQATRYTISVSLGIELVPARIRPSGGRRTSTAWPPTSRSRWSAPSSRRFEDPCQAR